MPTENSKTTGTEEANTSDGFDIEPLLQSLGSRGVGFYQVMQIVLQMSSLLGIAFSILSVAFIGYQPAYQCAQVNSTKLDEVLGLQRNASDDVDVVYEKCSIQVNANQSGQLQVYSLPCIEGYQYEGEKETSFFTEWDLTCEKSGLTEVTQTLMMVGQGVGAFLFTSLADRFGRKPVHVSCSIGMLIVAVATGLAPNYVFMVFCRVATGALQQGSGLVAFTMFIEILPRWLRGLACLVDGVLWATGVMLLPLLAFLMQDYSWRYLQFVLAAFSAYSLLLPWLMDESLRWLVANGRKTEAERVLKKASRRNNVPYDQAHAVLEELFHRQASSKAGIASSSLSTGDASTVPNPTADNGGPALAYEVSEKLLSETEADGPITEDVAEKEPIKGDFADKDGPINGVVAVKEPYFDGPIKVEAMKNETAKKSIENGINTNLKDSRESPATRYTVLDVLKHKVLLKTSAIIWFLWVANGLAYYGLTLTSAKMAGNRFLNFFLQVMVELPAYIIVFFSLRRFGRRNVGCTFMALASVSLLLSSVLLGAVTGPAIGPTTNALSLLGKFGISGSFCTLFMFCPELFPTNLRTAGLGMSSAVARIGGMLAPFSSNLAEIAIWAPGLIFGLMACFGSYIIMQLPETKGRSLPTTVQEMKAWHRKTLSQIQNTEIILQPDTQKSNC